LSMEKEFPEEAVKVDSGFREESRVCSGRI
jgi:hypothetical protein